MLRQLSKIDAPEAQRIFDACNDYAFLQDGRAYSSNAALEEFDAVPPGFPIESKFIFGIESSSRNLIGLVEGVAGYPANGIWYLGLMLIIPAARGSGVGKATLAALEHRISSSSFSALELAVLKENVPGLAFWHRAGFTIIREAPAATFGLKSHERWVLRKRLGDA